MTVRPAREADRSFWFSLDRHLPERLFDEKLRLGQALVLEADGRPAGLLRWNLFWDSIPFCTLLYVAEDRRGRGCGRALTTHWEDAVRRQGFGLAMTSTQADESAQHFWRSLGYRDCGGFLLPFPGYEQPTELILAKELIP